MKKQMTIAAVLLTALLQTAALHAGNNQNNTSLDDTNSIDSGSGSTLRDLIAQHNNTTVSNNFNRNVGGGNNAIIINRNLTTASNLLDGGTIQSPSQNSNGGGQHGNFDQKFVTQAIMAGTFEIQLGQLAVDNATNPDIAAYGQMLIDDHTALNDQLSQLALNNGFTVPDTLDKSHTRQLDKLSKMTAGDKLDRTILKTSIGSHKQSIKLYKNETKRGSNSDLQTFASDTLPILQDHLDTAKSLQP